MLNEGAKNYEAGRFDLALVEYNRALSINPKHALAIYEIAVSYYAIGNDAKALKHAKIASKDDSEIGIEATILRGGMLDLSGNSKKAMKCFQSGLKRFGDYYLLWYHYGISATNAEKMDEASKAFQQAVGAKLDHSESHFALARLMLTQQRLAEAIYPLVFYLMLQPKGEKSVAVYHSLNKLLMEPLPKADLSKNSVRSKGFNIQTAELLLAAFVEARTLEVYSSKSKAEIDAQVLSKVFTYLGNTSIKHRNDFYTSYYIPFFAQITSNEYTLPLVHFVSQSAENESSDWVNENADLVEEMFNFLDEIETNESVK